MILSKFLALSMFMGKQKGGGTPINETTKTVGLNQNGKLFIIGLIALAVIITIIVIVVSLNKNETSNEEKLDTSASIEEENSRLKLENEKLQQKINELKDKNNK